MLAILNTFTKKVLKIGKIAHIVVMQNHNQEILEQLLQELGVMNT
ncbi:MAG: hypothetical protein V7L27_10220 [Nostoc sp.]